MDRRRADARCQCAVRCLASSACSRGASLNPRRAAPEPWNGWELAWPAQARAGYAVGVEEEGARHTEEPKRIPVRESALLEREQPAALTGPFTGADIPWDVVAAERQLLVHIEVHAMVHSKAGEQRVKRRLAPVVGRRCTEHRVGLSTCFESGSERDVPAFA